MFLSIVMPSYNVEQYIKDCLASCVQSDMGKDDYEIIVINDGSKDATLDVVNSFAEQNPSANIRVISQENRGLSATRNRGITLAQGDYVWFVDSDDWIADNCIRKIYDIVESNHQPDIIVLNTILRKGGEDTQIDRNLPSDKGDGKYVYDNSYIFPYSGAPFYVFKRSFLLGNELSFKEGIYFEDCLFTPIALSMAKQCCYYAQPAYIYRLRENSITTSSISEKKLYDSIVVAEELIKRLGDERTLYKDVIRDAACRTYEVLFRYYILKSDRATQKKFLGILNSNNNWKSLLTDVRFKHKIYYFIERMYSFFMG
ncbi:MAG: glycosyltransferase family 2 protein [Paludibacteraceae bacterium]|nr:glycosyltransferase family 2 protein [Paludibacteraceae bacterium]